jgi:oligopeptide transport system substrate-binding protein
MSVDRKLLVESVTSRGESPAFSIVPPAVKRYEPPTGYLFNESGARIELKALGYCTRGASSAGCQSLPVLTLIHRAGPQEKKIALALAAVWRRVIGLDRLQVAAKEADPFARSVQAGDYDLALDDLAVEPEKPFDLLGAFRTGKPTAGGFSNKSFDALLAQAFAETEWPAARPLFRQAEALLMRDGGVLPLFHGTTVLLVSSRVAGFEPNIWGIHPWSSIGLLR